MFKKMGFSERRILVNQRKRFEIFIANKLTQKNEREKISHIDTFAQSIIDNQYESLRNEAHLYMPRAWVRTHFQRNNARKTVRKALLILLKRQSICIKE